MVKSVFRNIPHFLFTCLLYILTLKSCHKGYFYAYSISYQGTSFYSSTLYLLDQTSQLVHYFIILLTVLEVMLDQEVLNFEGLHGVVSFSTF